MSNPADFFMSMMSIESAQQDDVDEDDNEPKKTQAEIVQEYTKKIDLFSNSYQSSNLRVDYSTISSQVTPVTDEDRAASQVGWFYQLGLLVKRNFLNILRLPQTSYVKIVVTIITAIFTIVLF